MNATRSHLRTRLLLLGLGAILAIDAAGTPAAAKPDETWNWPLTPEPVVVAPFEAPAGPYGPGHRGADLAGTVAQSVTAVDAGRVSFAGSVAGRGVVVVDHGRLRTTYEPLLVAVDPGDEVRAGDVLGSLTLAGGHCLPASCLHLGARAGDVYVDPLPFLGRGPVRLLPLDGAPAPRPSRGPPPVHARPVPIHAPVVAVPIHRPVSPVWFYAVPHRRWPG